MQLFSCFNIASVFVLLAYNLLHLREQRKLLGERSHAAIRRFKAEKRKGFGRILSKIGFWAVIETLLISIAQCMPMMLVNQPFGKLMNTGANYFGALFTAPVFVIGMCILLKTDIFEQFDLIVPAYPLALIFVKIACFFGGCCRGIEWEKGFYNPYSELVEFPAQLLEAAAALFLFVFLTLIRNRVKKGTMFPIYLMSYSAIRFFTEMLRWEPDVFMGLKTYQILCIAGGVVGMAEYAAVCSYVRRDQSKKTTSPKERKRG